MCRNGIGMTPVKTRWLRRLTNTYRARRRTRKNFAWPSFCSLEKNKGQNYGNFRHTCHEYQISWYDIADINTAGSCVRLSHAKHRSISIVSNVVATIRPTWPNAWWDPGGTRVGPGAKSRTTTRLPMPCQEDGEGEIGIAHHKGIGVGIYEFQAVEPHDPEALWYVTPTSHKKMVKQGNWDKTGWRSGGRLLCFCSML